MEVSALKNRDDIAYCVDMYLALNDESFLPADRNTSLRSLYIKVTTGSFVRAVRNNGRIIAWICANTTKQDHLKYSIFQQLYYASDQSGVIAYRSVVSLHEEMYKFSIQTKNKYCMSSGSHLDSNNTFTRILEKNGWMRRGHIAAREILRVDPRLDSRLGSLGTFFDRQ